MNLLINIGPEDFDTIGLLNNLLLKRYHRGKVSAKTFNLESLLRTAKSAGCDAILCSNPYTIKEITPAGNPEDWRGAKLNFSVPVYIISPCHHIVSVPEGLFLMENDLDKLAHLRLPTYKYDYTIADTNEKIHQALKFLEGSYILVADIETSKQNTMTSIAFTPIDSKGQIGHTYCIPFKNWAKKSQLETALSVTKTLIEGPSYKVFHNGMFDTFHLLRHGMAANNYVWDTEYLWWAWQAELKKSLAFISSVMLPDYYFWKSESEASPLEYNCKDTINTARIFLKILKEIPAWAMLNYSKQFPMAHPLIHSNFEGFACDTEKLSKLKEEATEELAKIESKLRIMSATPNLNINSPIQLSKLLYQVLGAIKPSRTKSKSGTDAITLANISLQHPLIARFTNEILKYRKLAKVYSTYYSVKLLDGRILYTLNVDGTESGRLSGNKSTLYANDKDNYGLPIQTIPSIARIIFKADEGYLLGEADKSQSEARCTAYLADDSLLIEDLETPGRDFYCYMAFRFFGRHIDKKDPLRQIVKKIVHGTNYLMQEDTFIDSVGLETMIKLHKILDRPRNESLRAFASYLLGLYKKVYSRVPAWWQQTVLTAASSGRVITPDNWVRQVYGDPQRNTEIMRSIIAHKPQHLSVSILNKAYIRCYYELQVPSNGQFKLKLQNHDSIVFQAIKERFDYYMSKVIEFMDIGVDFADGRVLRIPTDAKFGPNWKEMDDWKCLPETV